MPRRKHIPTALLGFALGLSGEAALAQNLLPNGDFESSPANLNWQGNLDIDSPIHQPLGQGQGAHYGSVQVGGTQGERFAHSDPVSVSLTNGQGLRLAGLWGGGTTCQLTMNSPPCQNFVARTAVIRLRDGSATGAVVAEQAQPLDHGLGDDATPTVPNGFPWTAFNVTGAPASGMAVVQFGWINGNGAWSNGTAVHADALTLTKSDTSKCHQRHQPFADADADGDVDQEDFGIWQLCASGSDPEYPDIEPIAGYHCACFDLTAPFGRIEAADYQAFNACASGPDVPADPACDDAF